MRFSLLVSPLIATLVGFGGTLALIVAAAGAVGASPEQTSSWVAAICLAKGTSSALLSARYRMPIIAAWSTPGAALIGATQGIALEAAAGAFLLAAGLIVLTATLKPLGRLINRIPTPLAAAMLAGVLFRFVAAVFEKAPQAPALVLPLLALYLVVRRLNPMAAVLAVLFAGIALTFALGLAGPLPATLALSHLAPVMPRFEPAVLIGLGLPLYLVTMASQNLPGFAVLRADGYEPPVRAILAVTGLMSGVAALFGAHTINLAAISAAICTGPETHPDPGRRWFAGLFYAFYWFVLAAVGASTVAFFAVMPPALIATVAGLALVASCAAALGQAFAGESHRLAAVLTFAVTASGMTLMGIGAAFWGLLVGLGVQALDLAIARPGGR